MKYDLGWSADVQQQEDVVKRSCRHYPFVRCQICTASTVNPGERYSAGFQRLHSRLREEWLQGRNSVCHRDRAHLRDPATSPFLLLPEIRPTRGLQMVPYSQCHCGYEASAPIRERGVRDPSADDTTGQRRLVFNWTCSTFSIVPIWRLRKVSVFAAPGNNSFLQA